MIKYNISFQNPHKHFIDFSLTVSTNGEKNLYFQLPAWRPGRYELGNFSQNIYSWKAFNHKNESLNFKKINKDLWQVKCEEEKKITISYSFYANQLDAGSCYLDEKQLYINPVHCIFYIPERLNEKYELNLDIPDDYIIATSLEKNKKLLIGNNFDEIAESPIICSNTIKHDVYKVNNINFHLWFQGPCNIDWNTYEYIGPEYGNDLISKKPEFVNDIELGVRKIFQLKSIKLF